MQNHEVVTEEQRKFEAMLKYYQQRVTCCVCNRTKLRHAVDDLVSFLLQELSLWRARLERTECDLRTAEAAVQKPESTFEPVFTAAPVEVQR